MKARRATALDHAGPPGRDTFGGLSAANISQLFGADSSSSSNSTSPSTAQSTSIGVFASSADDTSKAIQAILAQAQINQAQTETLGSGSAISTTVQAAYAAQTVSSISLASPDGSSSPFGGGEELYDAAPGENIYAAVSNVDTVAATYAAQLATSSDLPSASVASPLSSAVQKMFDAVSNVDNPEIEYDGQTVGVNVASLAVTTIAQTSAGTAAETAGIMMGDGTANILAYVQAGALTGSQGAAQFSQQDQAEASTSATTNGAASTSASDATSAAASSPTANPALRLTIYADSFNAFGLAESQAKQLVSAYENYMAQPNSTVSTGFDFQENGIAGDISISGVLTSDSGQSGLSGSINGQPTDEEGYEAFMIPLQSS